ncbi:MAG: isocitrate lyase/phosphoenolpyruvate mutase family protein [Arenicellales bacterium]
MASLRERHKTFRQLHEAGCFVIPNPWDMGSARMMAALGARALATTSAGFAFTLGRPDLGGVTRDEALAHAECIVSATPLPVSGDFENGFADDPDGVAEAVRLAREVGLSGCSIEDTCMTEGNPAYDFGSAVDRIRAAADAARSLPDPFVLCARADGLLHGSYDLDEAVRRIQAFEKAGADLLYIPLLPDAEALERVARAVSKPVNALAAGAVSQMSLSRIAHAGIRRVSVGSMVARLTHAVIRDAMRSMLEEGSFAIFSGAARGAEIDRLLLEGGES